MAEDQKVADWGKWVEVKINALELLRKDQRLAGSKIYLGSVTDPYQPIETKVRLTRSLIEHMATLTPQPRLVIQTRSPFVAQDIELFKQFKSLRVNMTVTTDDDETRKRFEPTCASIDRRLQAVRLLSDAGIETTVCLSPLLPVSDPRAFAHRIIDTGTKRVTACYFHLGTRKFASGTRDNALTLAKEVGWNFEKYLETVSTLRKLIPNFVSSETGFGPQE